MYTKQILIFICMSGTQIFGGPKIDTEEQVKCELCEVSSIDSDTLAKKSTIDPMKLIDEFRDLRQQSPKVWALFKARVEQPRKEPLQTGSGASSSTDPQDSVSAEKPKSIGSTGHPACCNKPCTKFQPDKPDSCKKGENCLYCHADHARRKNRGQRDRHAMQHRLHNASRDNQRPEIKEIFDSIYNIPLEEVEKVKTKILAIENLDQRKKLVKKVVAVIAKLGKRAQNKRPNLARDRSYLMDINTYPLVPHLDSVYKWLSGALGATIRQMSPQADGLDLDLIGDSKQFVAEILGELQELTLEFDSLTTDTPNPTHTDEIVGKIQDLANSVDTITDFLIKDMQSLNVAQSLTRPLIIRYMVEEIITLGAGVIAKNPKQSKLSEDAKQTLISEFIDNINSRPQSMFNWFQLNLDDLLERHIDQLSGLNENEQTELFEDLKNFTDNLTQDLQETSDDMKKMIDELKDLDKRVYP